jgi:hypothetical protein
MLPGCPARRCATDSAMTDNSDPRPDSEVRGVGSGPIPHTSSNRLRVTGLDWGKLSCRRPCDGPING